MDGGVAEIPQMESWYGSLRTQLG